MDKTGQNYRIMIIPERNGVRTVSFLVSSIWVSVLLTGIAVVLMASLLLMYKSVQVAKKLHYYNALQSENEILSKENNQLLAIHQKFTRIDSIATYLEQLSAVTRPPKKDFFETNGKSEIEPITSTGQKDKSRDEQSPSVLPVDGWITQQFTKDTTQGGGAHPGIDIAAPAGMIIKAPSPGIVIAVLQDVDYGTMVVLQHEEGFITRYGHCAKAMVSVNDKIVRGQVIALVGNTGHSSAPHLHYEVIKNGKNVDPLQYIQTTGKTEK